MTDRLILYFDGSCEPCNPGGIATYGWLITRNGTTLASGYGEATRGPGATNNVAEYAALLAGLAALVDQTLGDGELVEIRGDSQLVIRQVTGEWGCHAEHLRPLCKRARGLVRRLQGDTCKITWRWVPRGQNREADALSRKAYQIARQTESEVEHGFQENDPCTVPAPAVGSGGQA